MALDIRALEIVHSGPAEIAVGQQKSTGLDNVDSHPQAGAQPHQASRILGDIGLIQRQSHLKPPILGPLFVPWSD
jgi:hypothetical protein